MRTTLVVVVAACGSAAAQKPVQPTAPTSTTAAPPPDAAVAVVSGPTGPYPEAGPACMPVGRYKATWDVTGAAVTRGGNSALVECGSFAQLVPAQTMDTIDIDVTNGNLIVHWPSLMDVTAKSECELEVSAHGIHITLRFVEGRGSGKAEYSFGTPNHPDETCEVTGATVALERKPW